MSWIKVIPYKEAKGALKKIYNRVKGPNDNIDNVLLIHSLRPHTLQGHMTLYKAVLHHSGNTLPKWYLECLGVYVSYLNQCEYCVAHHFEGLKSLWNDDKRSEQFMKAIIKQDLGNCFHDKESAGFLYAKKLTHRLHEIEQTDIETLRSSGFTDGEILEINQLCSYFNYVNRSVLGLGVNIQGDVLGLSPKQSDDPTNWTHE